MTEFLCNKYFNPAIIFYWFTGKKPNAAKNCVKNSIRAEHDPAAKRRDANCVAKFKGR